MTAEEKVNAKLNEANFQDLSLIIDTKTFNRELAWMYGGKDGDRGDDLVRLIDGGELEISPKQQKIIDALTKFKDLTITISPQGKVTSNVT